jgi:hypothetical protein
MRQHLHLERNDDVTKPPSSHSGGNYNGECSPLGDKRDGLSCWCREREVRRLCTHRRAPGEGGHAEEQRAGDGEKGSPSSTEVNFGDPLDWKGEIGHNEATLLMECLSDKWFAEKLQRRATTFIHLAVNKNARKLTLER